MFKKISKFNKGLVWFSVLFSVGLVGLASEANAVGATLFLAPSMGSYSTGQSFDVSVKVNTGGQAINTTEATLTFDPTKLKVANISKTGSVFSLWVQEPTFSNTDGTITFAGGKPTPGVTGSSENLVIVTFKGLTAGSASVNFSSGSVLADDNKGTNILSNIISGSYLITEKKIQATPPAEEEKKYTPPSISGGVPLSPAISSSTHPDENKWYSNNVPEFSWSLSPDVNGVSIYLNKSPTSNPGSVSDGLFSSKSYENIEDGIWYFHIKFHNQYGWSAIAHRKVLIDTAVPEPFKIIFDNQGDSTNPRPIFNFETTDSLSGVAYYEVIIEQEEGTTTTTTTTTTTPQNIKDNPYQPLPLPPGKHEVAVKAFDKAENFSEASSEFEILPIEAPKITKIPISVRIGEPLEIEGEAAPEILVRVYILKDGEKEPILEKVAVDFEGKFKLVYDKALAKGDYLVWAQTENEKGALSYPTEKYSLEVGLPPFLKIGKIAIDYLTTMITLIILIVGAGVVIFYSWYQISVWRKRLRKETKEVSESVISAFRALREEVQEQIEYLDGKPGLNKDERKVRDKLKEALDISEEFIGKEIKDVEKELE